VKIFGALCLIILLTGCSTDNNKLIHSKGHWGERSHSPGDEDFTQYYYADSDGHEVGKVKHYGFQIGNTATCLYGRDPGSFETPEEAQNAVETQCRLTEEQ